MANERDGQRLRQTDRQSDRPPYRQTGNPKCITLNVSTPDSDRGHLVPSLRDRHKDCTIAPMHHCTIAPKHQLHPSHTTHPKKGTTAAALGCQPCGGTAARGRSYALKGTGACGSSSAEKGTAANTWSAPEEKLVDQCVSTYLIAFHWSDLPTS